MNINSEEKYREMPLLIINLKLNKSKKKDEPIFVFEPSF